MITWKAEALRKGCQARHFFHGYTFHASLNRLVFMGLERAKMGFLSQIHQQTLHLEARSPYGSSDKLQADSCTFLGAWKGEE